MSSTLTTTSDGARAALLDAISRRELTPFVGAGFSCNITPSVAYRRFVETMITDDLKLDPCAVCRAFQDDYPRINDFAIHMMGSREGRPYPEIIKMGKKEFNRRLDRLFKDAKLTHAISPSEEHAWLQHLYLVRSFETIFTTNWDRTLELAADYSNENWDKLKWQSIWMRNGERQWDPPVSSDYDLVVVKYHGHIDDEDSMVAGEADYYERLRARDPMDYYLGLRLGNRGLLFLGYSLTDLNVRYTLYQVNGVRRIFGAAYPSFLVMVDDVDGDLRNKIDRHMSEAWNVRPYWLVDWDAEPWGDTRPAKIEGWLRDLAGLVKSGGQSEKARALRQRICDAEQRNHNIVQDHVRTLLGQIYEMAPAIEEMHNGYRPFRQQWRS